jgi:hypothetical protein
MSRLLLLILIPLGLLTAIGGIIYGATSHTVANPSQIPSNSSQSAAQGTIAHFLAGDDGTDYLQLDGSQTLYILHQQDFTPAINGTNTFANGDSISLVYRLDDTTDIDVTSTLGTHLVGKAFKVIEITSLDHNQVYATAEYSATQTSSQNTSSSSQNNWPVGGALIFVGLLLTVAGIFLPAALGGRKPQVSPYLYQQQYPPYPQYPQYPPAGYEPTQMANPYNLYNPGQPPSYPQQPQYPQYPQSPQYPQQGGSYEPTQWANPYNQPPQS